MTKLIFSIKAQVFWKERLVQVFSETLLRDQFEVFCCILKLWLHRLVGTMPHKKGDGAALRKRNGSIIIDWMLALAQKICLALVMLTCQRSSLSDKSFGTNVQTKKEEIRNTKRLIRKMGVLHSLFISPALKLTYKPRFWSCRLAWFH